MSTRRAVPSGGNGKSGSPALQAPPRRGWKRRSPGGNSGSTSPASSCAERAAGEWRSAFFAAPRSAGRWNRSFGPRGLRFIHSSFRVVPVSLDSKTWDVIVIGAGPAGLFPARALSGRLSVPVRGERARTGGAGAMTDGKLNLSPQIGLDLTELQISEEEAGDRIARIDEGFLEHGADRTPYGAARGGG